MKDIDNKSGLLPIGVVAKSYGVSENRIRRMEAAGLLKPVYVSEESGYRYYDSANISQIATILSLKSFGFVNEDIKEHFSHPGDYSELYRKLQDMQNVINDLVERMGRRIKNTNIYHCEIIEYEESYCLTKKVHVAFSLSAFSEIIRGMLYEAVLMQLPIDYTRAFLIKSDYMDYRKFKKEDEQDYTFCLPLRKKTEGHDIELIPKGKVVSFVWSFPGVDYKDIIPVIDKLLKSKGLTQIDTLRATYDIGGHTGPGVPTEDTIMHIFVPIK